MVDVTVVIPTRNRRTYLEEAVASVLSQTDVEVQLVVVNDASDDDTGDWLSSQTDRRLDVIGLSEHAERSAARNRGLALARGNFVVFLDDDDRLLPGALKRLVGTMRRHPGAIAAVGARVAFDERGHRRRAAHVRIAKKVNLWPVILCGWGTLPGQGHSIYRRSVFDAIGGWDESVVNVEDTEIWLRLSRAGPSIFIPASILDYRMHLGQWRPHDTGAVEDEYLSAFVASLPPYERPGAERFLAARRELLDAGREFTAGRCRTALRGYVRAVRVSPHLLRSPVTRRDVGVRLVKSLVGSAVNERGVARIRRVTAKVRDRLHRNPGDDRVVKISDVSARR